ncbi:hypothetical protein O6H91_17G007200 [Diphasiastrum complanatum]|nr:hypothetical protein O6H91_17G007200 [Diphasiastrum complanatum]
MDAMLEASVFLPKVLPSDVQGCLTRRDEKLLSAFLDANAKYLDACNAVRDGMGKLEHLQMHIKSILHVLDTNKGSLSEPQLTRARKSFHECLSELRNEQSQDQISSTTSLLQTISDKLVVPKNSEASSSLQAFAMAEYMANIISVFTLGISLAAFLPCKRGNVVEISHVSRHYAWSFELLSLQEEVKENAGMKKHLQPGLLRELDVLHICLTRLSSMVDSTISARKLPLSGEQDEEFRQAVEDLRHLSHDLEQGLQRMDHTISELFRQLIISRNAVLDLLSLAMGY